MEDILNILCEEDVTKVNSTGKNTKKYKKDVNKKVQYGIMFGKIPKRDGISIYEDTSKDLKKISRLQYVSNSFSLPFMMRMNTLLSYDDIAPIISSTNRTQKCRLIGILNITREQDKDEDEYTDYIEVTDITSIQTGIFCKRSEIKIIDDTHNVGYIHQKKYRYQNIDVLAYNNIYNYSGLQRRNISINKNTKTINPILIKNEYVLPYVVDNIIPSLKITKRDLVVIAETMSNEYSDYKIMKDIVDIIHDGDIETYTKLQLAVEDKDRIENISRVSKENRLAIHQVAMLLTDRNIWISEVGTGKTRSAFSRWELRGMKRSIFVTLKRLIMEVKTDSTIYEKYGNHIIFDINDKTAIDRWIDKGGMLVTSIDSFIKKIARLNKKIDMLIFDEADSYLEYRLSIAKRIMNTRIDIRAKEVILMSGTYSEKVKWIRDMFINGKNSIQYMSFIGDMYKITKSRYESNKIRVHNAAYSIQVNRVYEIDNKLHDLVRKATVTSIIHTMSQCTEDNNTIGIVSKRNVLEVSNLIYVPNIYDDDILTTSNRFARVISVDKGDNIWYNRENNSSSYNNTEQQILYTTMIYLNISTVLSHIENINVSNNSIALIDRYIVKARNDIYKRQNTYRSMRKSNIVLHGITLPDNRKNTHVTISCSIDKSDIESDYDVLFISRNNTKYINRFTKSAKINKIIVNTTDYGMNSIRYIANNEISSNIISSNDAFSLRHAYITKLVSTFGNAYDRSTVILPNVYITTLIHEDSVTNKMYAISITVDSNVSNDGKYSTANIISRIIGKDVIYYNDTLKYNNNPIYNVENIKDSIQLLIHYIDSKKMKGNKLYDVELAIIYGGNNYKENDNVRYEKMRFTMKSSTDSNKHNIRFEDITTGILNSNNYTNVMRLNVNYVAVIGRYSNIIKKRNNIRIKDIIVAKDIEIRDKFEYDNQVIDSIKDIILLRSNKPMVLFTYSTRIANKVAKIIKEKIGVNVMTIDSKTKIGEEHDIINSNEYIFVTTYNILQRGFNLNSIKSVLLYDLPKNKSEMIQAMGRIERPDSVDGSLAYIVLPSHIQDIYESRNNIITISDINIDKIEDYIFRKLVLDVFDSNDKMRYILGDIIKERLINIIEKIDSSKY